MIAYFLLLLTCLPVLQARVEVHQEFISSKRVSVRFEIVTESHSPNRPVTFDLFPRGPKTNIILLDTFNPVFNFSIQLVQPFTGQPLGDRIYRKVQFSGTNQPWINDTFTTTSGISLSVATEVTCARNYFGNRCENFCDAHLAKAARKRCDAMGRLRCDIGWMGPHCGQAVDPRKCSCENDGICASSMIHPSQPNQTSSNEQLICECTNGFTGTRCEISGFNQFQLAAPRPDACSVKDACLNGAKCFPNGPKVFCSCAVGFIGEFCEISLTTTTPTTVEITVSTSGYSSAVYITVAVFVIFSIIIGCFKYKFKPMRQQALARGQVPEPYKMLEVKSMLIDPEASEAQKKVFTIEDSVQKIDEEVRYTSAPRKYESNNEYAVIQKSTPPPPSLSPPSIPACHYV